MKFDLVTIENYRALKHVDLTLSEFNCIIGENNSGKSSTLLALSLFINGTKINQRDFFDKSKPIFIETMISLSEDDLDKISEGAYSKIDYLITDHKLNLVRKYDPECNSALFYKKLVPRDPKFNPENIDYILSGKRGKAIEDSMKSHFSEYSDFFEGITNQGDARDVLESIIRSMKPEDLDKSLTEIPSSQSKIIQALFPEPIYIPAVKDANDEVKTTESATLGKIISSVLKIIGETSRVQELIQAFDNLEPLLNKVEGTDGQVLDNRLDQIQDLERSVNKYLAANFLNASLEFHIPSPSLKQVFNNTQIVVNDGIKASLDSKGDGLKRAVTFALLRTYEDLKQARNSINTDGTKSESIENDGYLFLFEEPELYLHPSAQNILFEALSNISKSNQVIVTTHSPIFFSPTNKGSYIKMKKKLDNNAVPYSRSICIDLSEIGKKDLFQLICFENNSAAFFTDKLILVEGDSDLIFLKHIAKKLNSEWNFDLKGIPVVKISGKGNIAKYKKFFNEFEIDVHSILDLDVLIEGFDKIGASPESWKIRQKLIKDIDTIIGKENLDCTISKKKMQNIVQSRSFRENYNRFIVLANEMCSGRTLTSNEIEEIKLLFSEETKIKRQEILESSRKLDSKYELLEALRNDKVYVLSKGAVEKYYPNEARSINDKPSKALKACELLPDKESVLNICPLIKNGRSEEKEFEIIFKNIIESKLESKSSCKQAQLTYFV